MKIKDTILYNSKNMLVFFAVMFFLLSLWYNYNQRQTLYDNVEQVLYQENINISNQVHMFMNRYLTIVELMYLDHEMVQFIHEIQSDSDFRNHPLYESILLNLQSIQASDPHLTHIWLASNAANNYITQDRDFNVKNTVPDFVITERPWYTHMFQSDDTIVITPYYISYIDNKATNSIYYPVLKDPTGERTPDNIVGTLGIDLHLNEIITLVESYKIGENGFAMIADTQGRYLIKPSTLAKADNILEEPNNLILIGEEISMGRTGVNRYQIHNQAYFVSYAPIGIADWQVVSFVPLKDVTDQFAPFNRMSLLFLGSAMILVIFTFIVSRVNVQNTELSKLNDKLIVANMESEAAYEQVRASEHVLRKQLDEIHEYAGKLEEKEAYIEKLAYLDPLTQLPNRRNFAERLNKVLNEEHSGAVMLLDLDNFKEINDTQGHMFGDEVLRAVAGRLSTFDTSELFVSRFGGDEFLLLMDGTSNKATITAMVDTVMDLFKSPLAIEENNITISASLGIALYPEASTNRSELIMYADTAMYQVKNSGRNNYCFFTSDMAQSIKDRMKVEAIIRDALLTQGFTMVYQPKVVAADGTLNSAEALIRFKAHRISPGEFIPIAEEMGSIIEIGRWTVEESFRQLNHWQSVGLPLCPIAINFSARQLSDSDFISFMEHCLDKYDVPAKYIHIEITESIIIDDPEEALAFLKALKDLGIQSSLDDFGTGYSSLSYLSYLPVDELKLDKSFCDRMEDSSVRDIITNVIRIAHSLDMKVVAEGIETERQHQMLKEDDCDLIQGYYFSKPLSPEDFTQKYLI